MSLDLRAAARMTRRTLPAETSVALQAVHVPIASLPEALRQLATNISEAPGLNDFQWGHSPQVDASNRELELSISAHEVVQYIRGLHGSSPKTQEARAMAFKLLDTLQPQNR